LGGAADFTKIDDLHLVIAVRTFRGRPFGLDDAAARQPVFLAESRAKSIQSLGWLMSYREGEDPVREEQLPAGLFIRTDRQDPDGQAGRDC